jgi:magnesium transporter
LRLFRYGPDELAEGEVDLDGLAATAAASGRHSVSWFDFVGVGHGPSLTAIGEVFDLHPLVVEDIANTYQRPKADTYEDHVFIVLRVPYGGSSPDLEQIGMIVGPGLVLTFQERAGDCFEPVRERLRTGRVRLRGSGSDYLAYALIDAAIDSFFPILEHHGERLEDLEQAVLHASSPETLAEVQRAKRDLLRLRRSLWPYRELIGVLSREDTDAFGHETQVFLRDCHDHTVQLVELVEHYREIGAGLVDLHMSIVSNRMNEVMKTLTIIATIFIPLTFIAGVYGMNFDPAASPWNMPELSWYWGYPMAMGLMAAVGILTAVYFRRKGWLGTARPARGSGDDAAKPGDADGKLTTPDSRS